jgi:hypothetical protein
MQRPAQQRITRFVTSLKRSGGACAAVGALSLGLAALDGAVASTALATGSQPRVTSLNPSHGPATGGTQVSIRGTSLSTASAVHFGSASAGFRLESGRIEATAPAGSGTVHVTVTTPVGTSAAGTADLYSYEPVVTSISPASGPAGGGAAVTITGAGLAEATAVMFGSLPAKEFTVESPTSIIAISPAAPEGQVGIRVTSPQGTSRNSAKDTFKFTPTVTGVSPNSGPPVGGTPVTVTGTGFEIGEAGTIIAFAGRRATSVDCTSTTECSAIAPEMASAEFDRDPVDVRATINHVWSPKSAADHFEYSGLYLVGERGRLRGVEDGVIVNEFITGNETNGCSMRLAGGVENNGESTVEISLGVIENLACIPSNWFDALPGNFTLKISADGAAEIDAPMGVDNYDGCVYEGDEMSGSFNSGGLPFSAGLSGTFAFVEEEVPGEECAATEEVFVSIGSEGGLSSEVVG